MVHETAYRCYCELASGRSDNEVEWLKWVIRDEKRASLVHAGRFVDEEAIRQAEALQPAWHEAAAIDRSSEPFEDAYQAGLWLHLQPYEYMCQDNVTKLYRGQRDADWPNISSLFRPTKTNPATRRARLLSLAGTLVDCLGLDVQHAFAASQHYSGEADIPSGYGAVATWLLDVTWNPFIALAFATHGAKSGGEGVISVIHAVEWREKLGAIAKLDIVELDLTRPRRQQAAFVNSRFPELLDDYVPFRLLFKQHNGLEFEDCSVGACRASMYPVNDPVCDVVRRWAEEEKANRRPPIPSTRLVLPPQAQRAASSKETWWVDPNVYLDLCHLQLERLDCPLDASFSIALDSHLKMLAAFHSWARALTPELRARGLLGWRPGLGGLTWGSSVARARATEGQPPDLMEMTSQYNTLDIDVRQRLVSWIRSNWQTSFAKQTSLRNGTADPTAFLSSLSLRTTGK
jgi:hypothetical protein